MLWWTHKPVCHRTEDGIERTGTGKGSRISWKRTICLRKHSYPVHPLITQLLGLAVARACLVTTGTAPFLAESRWRK